MSILLTTRLTKCQRIRVADVDVERCDVIHPGGALPIAQRGEIVAASRRRGAAILIAANDVDGAGIPPEAFDRGTLDWIFRLCSDVALFESPAPQRQAGIEQGIAGALRDGRAVAVILAARGHSADWWPLLDPHLSRGLSLLIPAGEARQ